jgi:Ni,Fe-hydrogenase maturation factor
VGIAPVKETLMKPHRAAIIKGITTGMEIASFLLKKDMAKYTISVTDVVDAGKDSGIMLIAVMDALRDGKLSPEETLELAEQLTATKKSLDKALTTLIKDLKDYAVEQTQE